MSVAAVCRAAAGMPFVNPLLEVWLEMRDDWLQISSVLRNWCLREECL